MLLLAGCYTTVLYKRFATVLAIKVREYWMQQDPQWTAQHPIMKVAGRMNVVVQAGPNIK